MDSFAVIIPCYNRLDTLKALLSSLERAHYCQGVSLVFSIDNSGSDLIVKFAEKYNWRFGKKTIIHHKEKIGLRKNIISCGDLTKDYDAVIILEDDLLVSPSFFDYASAAYEFYKDNDIIAGISLYSYRMSENLHEFNPLTYGYDTYFIQWTSSWGQLWTKRQWATFKEWYNKKGEDITAIPIPDFVKTWTHSWKKYNIAYLVDTNRFYVYPIESYTSVQPTLGTHVAEVKLNNDNIVPLCFGSKRNLIFQPYNATIVYDCFFEVKSLNVELDGETVTVDLNIYGNKTKDSITQRYFVSSKRLSNTKVFRKWGITTIPFETNIINSNEGDDLFLYDSNNFLRVELTPSEKVAFRVKLTIKERILYYMQRAIQLLRQ